jgi:hypothetical protein
MSFSVSRAIFAAPSILLKIGRLSFAIQRAGCSTSSLRSAGKRADAGRHTAKARSIPSGIELYWRVQIRKNKYFFTLSSDFLNYGL